MNETVHVPIQLRPPRRRGRIGGVSVGQIVALQLAALVTVVTYPQPDWVFIPVLLAALAVLAVAFTRRHGRWWYEDAIVRWRLRRRRRAARRAGGTGHSDLSVLAPAVATRDAADRSTTVGVGSDEAGWYSVVAVAPATNGYGEAGASLDGLVRLLGGMSASVSSLQVVHHAVPVSTMLASAGDYLWVAVRLSTSDASAEAATRGGGVEGVHRALAAAVGRIGKTLQTAGLEHRVLTADELVEALAAVAGLNRTSQSTARHMPKEQWSAWHGTDAVHVCFRLTGSTTRPLADLVAALGTTSSMSATLAVRCHPAGGQEMDGLLRVAAGVGRVDACVSEARALAARVGLKLSRLDGEHGAAVYALAPTGAALA